MQIWVLHIYNDDGTLTVTPITTPAQGMEVLRKFGKDCTSFGGPAEPKIGDRKCYRDSRGEIAYAILGQVHYN